MAADSGNGDSDPEAKYDRLERALRHCASSGEAVAIGICYDFVLPEEDEGASERRAIGFVLEHSAGETVDLTLPYRKDSYGRYSYDPLIPDVDVRQFFGVPEEDDSPEAAAAVASDDGDGDAV